MHSNFSDWYRLAGMTPTNDIVATRSAAIEGYAAGKSEIVSLTRFFYRLGKPNDEFVSAFRAAFKKADSVFQMSGNDQELCVLAGTTLIHVIDTASSDIADFAALAVVSASAQNLRPCPTVREIPEIAAAYLSKRAINRALLATEPPSGGSTQTPEFQRLEREVALLAEETNMLWWLFSEQSRDAQRRWEKNFTVPAVALIAGKELADLTRAVPGPVATMAFLDRVIRCAKSKPPTSISVVEAINAVEIGWRQKYAAEGCPTELDDLLPISYGIKVSLTAPENSAWFPAFVQGTGIASNSQIAPDVLAYQLFQEILLCRRWKTLK
jgi:hypothetical protein